MNNQEYAGKYTQLQFNDDVSESLERFAEHIIEQNKVIVISRDAIELLDERLVLLQRKLELLEKILKENNGNRY